MHLGLPTFLDRDAATAEDDRSVFQVAGFDPTSWIDDVRAMGLEGLILVVRDEDGFRLADTDILPKAAKALADAGIPFGISIAERGGAEPLPDEVADLVSRFGPFFEVRVASDIAGARSDGRGLANFDACISSAEGPDFVTAPIDRDEHAGTGSAARIERVISIRPTWYWRVWYDGRLRGVAELEDAWFGSVGRGEPLLVGLPADRDGRFRTGDVARMIELRKRLETVFAHDLAREAKVTVSSAWEAPGDFGAASAIDGNDATFWATADGAGEAWIELAWDQAVTVDCLELREPERLGSRCDRWIAEAHVDGAWREIAGGTAIGFRATARFPAVRTDRLRVRLFSSNCPPALSRLAVFAAPPTVRISGDARVFEDGTVVTIEADRPGVRILYTLDGRDPVESGSPADGPIPIDSSCLVRAIGFDAEGRAGYPIAERFTRIDGDAFLTALPEERIPASLEAGLHLERHDGVKASLEELGASTSRSTSKATDVRLPADRPADHFALVFRGFLRVPEDGLYTFSLQSDDASRLYLHDRLVVDRDGLQVYDVREGRVALRKGLHPLRVEYCEFAGRESLSLWWSRAGAASERVPADAYAR